MFRLGNTVKAQSSTRCEGSTQRSASVIAFLQPSSFYFYNRHPRRLNSKYTCTYLCTSGSVGLKMGCGQAQFWRIAVLWYRKSECAIAQPLTISTVWCNVSSSPNIIVPFLAACHWWRQNTTILSSYACLTSWSFVTEDPRDDQLVHFHLMHSHAQSAHFCDRLSLLPS